jgi:hypothetical protein
VDSLYQIANNHHKMATHRMMIFVFVVWWCLQMTEYVSSYASCSSFVTLPGTAFQEDLAYFYQGSRTPWNTNYCGTIFPGATFPIMSTMHMGEFLCPLTGDNYPWAGLSRLNVSTPDQGWVWVDGLNQTSRIPLWTSTPSGTECYGTPTVCYTPADCGQISCSTVDYGKLYDGRCAKNAPNVCEIKRRFFS